MTLRSVTNLEAIGTQLGEQTSSERRIQEQALRDANLSRQDVLAELDEADDPVAGSFASAAGTLERRQRASGRTLTAREQESQRRRLGLGRALATVDARNRRVDAIRQRRDFATSTAGDLRSILEGQLLRGRSGLAQAEAGREVDFQRRRAEFEQNRASAIGTLAGIGLSFVPGGQFGAALLQGGGR